MQEIMNNLETELTNTNTNAGFRFVRLEVLNWGTFNDSIWKIEPKEFNSLLTGDIGAGKSTLVDAITTLLVPHQKITYNKAAGAEGKERNIYSYIRGEYKSEKDEVNNTSKSVYLRPENTYTVLLGYFHNGGFNQSTTIAQVFWIKNNKPEKMFIIADSELNIKDDFSNFGKEITNLKKVLKQKEGVQVFDSFNEYSNKFRQIFGIRSDKALELFYQTVSMKSVGNLTDFVRNQMLEKTDVKSKIEELKKRFEDLSQAYTSVQKAKKQIEFLNPLISDAQEFEKISAEISHLNKCLNALPIYFAVEKSDRLKDEIIFLDGELNVINNKIKELEEDLEKLREDEIELSSMLKGNEAGKRLSKVVDEIRIKEKERSKKLHNAEKYNNLASELDLDEAENEKGFYDNLSNAKNKEEKMRFTLKKIETERDELKEKIRPLRNSFQDQFRELESLRNRKTQIPEQNLKIRDVMLRALDLQESDLPYVGELLKVKESESEWEGAIERILHGFGLSLLVTDDNYKEVSDFVNKTDLKGRVVYFRVPRTFNTSSRGVFFRPDSLLNKVEIKPQTKFYEWLENELFEKYNYICCDNIDMFQRENYALTKQGQVKSGKFRHEKDDRKSIHDRRSYILGWANVEKLKAIQISMDEVENKIDDIEDKIKEVEIQRHKTEEMKDFLRDFIKYNDYAEINWSKESQEIKRLLGEKSELEGSSDELKVLRDKLEILKMEQIKPKEEEINNKREEKGKKASQKKRYEEEIAECNQLKGDAVIEDIRGYFENIKGLITTQESELNLKNADRIQLMIRNKIEEEKRVKDEIETKLRDSVINRMITYKKEYPSETTDVDSTISSIPEFKAFAEKLEHDDLPRHEQRFKRLLNEETINSVALFKNQLEIFEKEIESKIKDINKSLVEIDYNPGTYIKLDNQKSNDPEIAKFKNDLKNCLENTIGDTDLYNEEKFMRVKIILDRFTSGDVLNINWTNKVIDVRNWFTFTASERWREDDVEREFYSDSSGKSGGQKEKLAYTILASALAYQFGLEWHEKKSKSFRFVVIDEAFGRGSDESTRYGLELFKKLNLQLLIVTPMQKINIIEDYINSVHFVSNQAGQQSVVRNLTKKEYVQEKMAYLNMVRGSGLPEEAEAV
jgi:uncharacterized protein YPO0396